VFGGQVIAQALVAAQATAPEDRPAHSLHAYFLRGGSEEHAVEYRVERGFDGGSFATRRVIALQEDRQILACSVSFQRREDGPGHQAAAMPDMPPPEELEPEDAVFERYRAEIEAHAPRIILRPRPIEVRAVNPTGLLSCEPLPPEQHVWFRARAPIGPDLRMHQVILAYASDMNLLSTAMRPHRVHWQTPGFQSASLDHAMWFHRPTNFETWHLYAQDSPSASGGRGFIRGAIYSEAGVLVASVAQEGLIRMRKKTSLP